jgi:hypothetical protein
MNVYDLKHAKDCGEKVRIEVQVGQNVISSGYAVKMGKEDYQWGTAFTGDKLREVKMYLPVDAAQIPDVFINLITETVLSGDQRIGYIRKPVT